MAKQVEPVNKVQQEYWKDVVGYEGLYQVSNLGRVRSCDRIRKDGALLTGVILKQAENKLGYKQVNLCKNGHPRLTPVHRIVAMAFLPNPNEWPEVNHLDENPRNNVCENLEWCTHRYNMNYGTAIARRGQKVSGTFLNRKDLSKEVQQLSLDGRFIRSFPSVMEASRQTGSRFGLIAMCCRGERGKTNGYKWQYAR